MNPSVQNSKLEQVTQNRLNVRVVVPDGLLFKIFQRLHDEQFRLEIRNLKIKLSGAVLFFISFIITMAFLVKISFVSSNTSLKFLSLIFTDFSTVLDNWQDYTFSILENLPLGVMALGTAAFLGIVLVGEYIISRWRDFKNLAETAI